MYGMSYLKAVLIADDLTGSLDSAAPFAAMGLTCFVAVAPDALEAALALSPDVVSVNLGTRELPPQIARARAEAASRTDRPSPPGRRPGASAGPTPRRPRPDAGP